MLKENIEEILKNVPGNIGLYYKNLNTGATIEINEEESYLAASIIKLPILIETLNQIKDGVIRDDMMITLREEDKVPSCGALNYLHNGIEVTIKDLYTLMIVLSDNTATNILINKLGIENINKTMNSLGLKNTRVNRLLYDEMEQKKGKENYFSPKEMGLLLEQIYNGELIHEKISEEIQRIMKLQLMDSKIPYLLPEDTVVAHKTGEATGITHDVGIIYSKNPFILCFASNNTIISIAEDALRKIALLCYEESVI
jgi:beta-lactamase class A